MAITPNPKAPKAEPTFKKLSTLQVVAVDDLLRAKCRLHDGFAVYDDGYDDARIAAEAVPEYKGRAAHVIAQYRVKLIGPLRAVPPSAPQGDMSALEKRVADLERQLATLAGMLGVDIEGNSLKPFDPAVLDGGTRLL